MKKIKQAVGWLILAFVVPGLQAEQPLIISSGIPAGFDSFMSPKQGSIDVYFGRRYLANLSATYTPDTIEFVNPEAIVRLVPDILDAGAVSKALEGELDVHSERICASKNTLDCGIINPLVAGIIFDESRFRADLFIHPDYLKVRQAQDNRFLADSEAGAALIQNLTANFSGDLNQNSNSNYSIFGDSFFSFKENSLQASWDVSRKQNVSINQLLFARDYQGLQWQTGLVYTSGFGLDFNSSQRLWGARVASSYSTRTDRSFTEGSPLVIFMPVRGRFEIIREERLISSGFLEAGNQALDTSNFPSGAYDVTVRLLDEQGGLLSEEISFFAKQSRLPPIDEREYFLEGGRTAITGPDRVLPDFGEDFVVRAGVNQRLSATVGGTLAASVTQGQSMSEFSLFKLGEKYELAPAVMLASDGEFGARIDGRYALGSLNISANYIKLWRKDGYRDPEDFDLLGNGFTQSGISMNYPVWGGSARYRYNSNSNSDNKNIKGLQRIRQSFGYSRPVYRDNLYTASLRFDTSWTSDDELTGLISLQLWRNADNWRFSVSPETRYERDSSGHSDTESSMQLSASYDDKDTFDGDFRSTLRVKTDSKTKSAGLSTRYGSVWGSGELDVNYANDGSKSNTTYAGSLATSLMASNQVVAFGGASRGRSAVVVTVEGAKVEDRFDVYIDNVRQGYALGGKPSIIQLSPFDTYQISIRPETESLFSYEGETQYVTVYPGNVMDLAFKVQQVRVVFGRVMHPNGEWLTNANISGGTGFAVSDEFGVFQAEITSDAKELMFKRQGFMCTYPLMSDSYESDYINLGNILCSINTPQQQAGLHE